MIDTIQQRRAYKRNWYAKNREKILQTLREKRALIPDYYTSEARRAEHRRWEESSRRRKGILKRQPKSPFSWRERNPLGDAFSQYQWSAKERDLPFVLSISQFSQLVTSPCHYCLATPLDKGRIGIDRKDSDLGYDMENCVSCCKRCNFMKNTQPYDDFIQHVKRISDNFKH